MGKFSTGLVREYKTVLAQQQQQTRLKRKYGLQGENVVVVESKAAKSLIKALGGIVRVTATVIILSLACVGILAILYPNIRTPLVEQLSTIWTELKNLVGF